MRILLTADPELPVPPTLYGGIERVVNILVNEFVKGGHEVTLLAHKESKVPCRLIAWGGSQSNGIRNTLRNSGTLLQTVLTGKYDIVHSFSRLAYLAPILPLSIPKIMSYQREPTTSQIKKAVQLARKNSLRFTGCSDYISNQIKPFATASTVYNCVPIDQYQFTSSVPADAPLTFLGRIEPIKGTHIAIEVAKKANRRLLIAGNIPAEGTAYFEEKIKPFLDDQIQYLGPVNDRQKNEMLGKSAAFLMPIQWNEPFGIVMAEAMACGTPVLGFPFGSVPEVVENGVSGYVCSNTGDMIDKISGLETIDRKQVRKAAEVRFSDAAIVGDYLQLYKNMLRPEKSSLTGIIN